MWCNVCQNDVAIEVGADNRRVNCASCGHVIGETAASKTEPAQSSDVPSDDRAAEARELLDRWAKAHHFDPYESNRRGEAARTDAAGERADNAATQPKAAGQPGSPILRTDEPHRQVPAPLPIGVPGAPSNEPVYRVDASDDGVPDPKYTAAPQQASEEPRIANGEPSDAERPNTASTLPQSSLESSAAELDRLTKEILSRVSRIGAEKAAEPAVVSDSVTSVDDDQVGHGVTSAVEEAAPRRSNELVREQPVRRPHFYPEPASELVASTESPAGSEQARSRTTFRTDSAHEPMARPHSSLEGIPSEPASSESNGNWFSGVGQGLAWLGILGLTTGTSLVIVSYFGGPVNYAPMGWLVSTIGQMLLFLGIVTLVSSGMEQTTNDVRSSVDEVLRRIEELDDRIVRIDAAESSGPPAPHFAGRTSQRTREVVHARELDR